MNEKAKKVFTGAIFDVYQWEQEMFDGSKAIFERLARPDVAIIFAFTTDGKIIVIDEEQPGRDGPSLDLPGGRLEKEEDHLVAAKRELLEETGYISDDWMLLDDYSPAVKIEYREYIYIAKNCKKVSKQKLDGGEKIEVKLLDFKEFVDMTCNQKIPHWRETLPILLKMGVLDVKFILNR